MTTHSRTLPTRQLLWISDIHLDQAQDEEKRRFFDKLETSRCDALLITGDITTAINLARDLGKISRAAGSTPVMFVLGNHDYFGSSFEMVDREVAELCGRHQNLIPLGYGEIIQLSPQTALIGHRGWFDGQAGAGARTRVGSADRYHIDDFKNLNKAQYFQKLRDLGVQSADYFRRVLPAALQQFETVLLATHVPPCTQALRHQGSYCQWERQPFFSNRAAGNAIIGISRTRSFASRQVIVYSGHSHCYSRFQSDNVEIRVAGAQPGFPALNGLQTIH
ncbi:MAG: metallophosphoesterase [Luteolibacter sp.]|uniref:metallophosphoesterase n=1 Tax=Luteolibacter sp. TaxID=1962973 RepID=UPI0032642EBC